MKIRWNVSFSRIRMPLKVDFHKIRKRRTQRLRINKKITTTTRLQSNKTLLSLSHILIVFWSLTKWHMSIAVFPSSIFFLVLSLSELVGIWLWGRRRKKKQQLKIIKQYKALDNLWLFKLNSHYQISNRQGGMVNHLGSVASNLLPTKLNA